MGNVIVNGVEHPDSRDTRTKVFDAAWKVPTIQSHLPNEVELEALRAKMIQDKWNAEYHSPQTSYDRKEQMRLQREQDAILDAREAEQLQRERLEQPRIARKVAEAVAVRNAIAADSEREYVDILAIDRIIDTYSDPKGNTEIADAALRKVVERETDLRLTRAKQYKQQADDFQSKFEREMRGITLEDDSVHQSAPAKVVVEGETLAEQGKSLSAAMSVTPGYGLADMKEVFAAQRELAFKGNEQPLIDLIAKYAAKPEPKAELVTEDTVEVGDESN